MGTVKRILRTSQIVLASRVLSAALQAVLLALFAREVDPATFASVGAIVGTLMALMAFSDLGLQALAQRTAARTGNSERASAILMTHDALNWAAGLLTIAILLGTHGLFDLSPWIPVLGLWFASEKIANARSAIAISFDRPTVTAANMILRRVIALGLFAAAGAFSISGDGAYILAIALSSAIGALASYAGFDLPRFQLREAREHANEARHLWFASMGLRLRQFDATTALWMLGPHAAASFIAVTRLAGPLRMLVSSVAAVLLPIAAKSGRGEKEIHATLTVALFLQAVAFLAAGIHAETVLLVALGGQYTGAVSVLRVFLLGLWFASACDLMSAVMQGLGLERTTGIIAWATSTLVILGIAIGGYLDQSLGAAIGSTAALGVHFLLLLIQYRRLVWRTPSHDATLSTRGKADPPGGHGP